MTDLSDKFSELYEKRSTEASKSMIDSLFMENKDLSDEDPNRNRIIHTTVTNPGEVEFTMKSSSVQVRTAWLEDLVKRSENLDGYKEVFDIDNRNHMLFLVNFVSLQAYIQSAKHLLESGDEQ